MMAKMVTTRVSRSLVAPAVALALVMAGHAQRSLAAEIEKWLTGKQLDEQLSGPIAVSWTGMPLRQGLTKLSRSQRVSLLLDRRVDPGRRIDVTIEEVPLEVALRGIAEHSGLGMTMFGPVAYFGPPRAAAHLRTLAAVVKDDVLQMEEPARRRLLAPRSWQWDDFTTPRELLGELARKGRFQVRDQEAVPHDLWAGAGLPPIAPIDVVVLIAVQFDLTCQVSDGGTDVRLIPIAEPVELRRAYPGGSRPHRLADRWRALAPDSRIEVAAGKIIVRGLLEDHERVRGGGRRPTAPVSSEQTRVYTLRVKDAPLDALLEELQRRLSITVKMDRAALARAGVALDRRVSLDVKSASLDDLLKAAIGPAGLVHFRRGNVVEIVPAKK